MAHQDYPRVRSEGGRPEFHHRRVLDEGGAEGVGLSADLSRLPREIRDAIRFGDNGGYRSRDEARVEMCVAMFRASYGVAEIWAVMTDPCNCVSARFFEEHGDLAEATLERIISTAHDVSGDG